MNFNIFVITDKLEKFYLEAIKEYDKRLTRSCKTRLVYLKNYEQLFNKLSDKSYKIIISTTGPTITSEELALQLNNFALTGISEVTIIIGAPNIPHDEKLTLSPLDMNLGLQTTILFEQIYRSFRILNNHAYHK